MTESKGKIVLVTGAGRGVGKAIALAFAADKYRVVITGRTGEICESKKSWERSHVSRKVAKAPRI